MNPNSNSVPEGEGTLKANLFPLFTVSHQRPTGRGTVTLNRKPPRSQRVWVPLPGLPSVHTGECFPADFIINNYLSNLPLLTW